MVMSVSVEVGTDTQCEVRLSEQMHHTICICGKGTAGPSRYPLLLCLSPQKNFLLTHLHSFPRPVGCESPGAVSHSFLTHLAGVCVYVCVLPSSSHCGSHSALSVVCPTVVLLLHSAHRHRSTLSDRLTNIPLTMSTERGPTAR